MGTTIPIRGDRGSGKITMGATTKDVGREDASRRGQTIDVVQTYLHYMAEASADCGGGLAILLDGFLG